MDWNDMLKLPAATLQGDKRIPWTVLNALGELKKKEGNVVRSSFREIQAFAVLNHSNTHMQPVVDDSYNVQSVIFLSCTVADMPKVDEASRIVHGCFPNPTVLLVHTGMDEFTYISVGLRRNNLAKHGAFVTDKVQTSGFFRTGDPLYTPYVESIAYDRLPQTTLLAFVSAMGDRTEVASVIPTLGYYPTCRDGKTQELLDLVKEANALTARVIDMDQRRVARNTPLAESTKLRVQMHELEEKKKRITKEIEEVCE